METTHRLPTGLLWALLIAALAQAVVPLVPAFGPGTMPNESTTDLLITPAGYTFSIWGLIYVLSIAVGIVLIVRSRLKFADPTRLLSGLLVAFLGAAAWIVFSAAEVPWATSVVLTLMAVALIDTMRLAAQPPATDAARETVWVRLLVRSLVGIYAAWATAAMFQNWASDIGAAGADPGAVSWQLALLVAGALVGAGLTVAYGASLPFYPLTLLWAFTGICVTAWGETTAVLAATAGAMLAVLCAWVWSLLRARA